MAWFSKIGVTPEERKQNPTYQQLSRLLTWGLEQGGNYWDFGYPMLTAAFPTLRSGLAFTISPENVGKSQFLTNIGYGILQNTENSFWLDLSLDDSVEDRFSYLFARAGNLPISLSKTAAEASDEDKNKRKLAFRDFYQRYGNRYRLIGASELAPVEQEDESYYAVEDVIQILQQVRQELGPEAKLFVTVDGFHDLDLRARADDENQRLAKKSLALKRAAAENGALLWMTAHTRKDSRRRGLTADVLKGEGRILYDAKVIMHLFSDYNLNKDSATIFWEELQENGSALRRPVLELDIQKNKCGSYKGILFYNFEPRRCQVMEGGEEDQKFYRDLIFKK